jgi:hypothetical protein
MARGPAVSTTHDAAARPLHRVVMRFRLSAQAERSKFTRCGFYDPTCTNDSPRGVRIFWAGTWHCCHLGRSCVPFFILLAIISLIAILPKEFRQHADP